MSSLGQPGVPDSRVRIVVATSVMLTFISYWRAASVILNDLGSSAFYASAIAEQAIGKSAPWLILAVMLFAFTVRAVYVESCSMFVRGGVYRIVKEALGGNLAKVAVSALMFDYILTGPISGVAAGQYVAGLINELLASADVHGWIPVAIHRLMGSPPHVNGNLIAVAVAVFVTVYYWWQNTKGIEESSEKAFHIMIITTVMVVMILVWSGITLMVRGAQLPPLPIPRNLHFAPEALGFLRGTNLHLMFGLFGVMMAFGHSVLAMSGEETLAQVYREIAHPKLKNLKRTAIIIGIYSFMFTGVVSLLAVMIVPDSVRIPVYGDNLIAGLAMYLVGPQFLRILFRIFVVAVGFLMLSGAVNTAIVGSNGVLNRVSEDGVLTEWFRRPHRRYGTTYRNINTVVALQLAIIILSRGNVYLLGEAYAFGVIWSFVFNSLAMLVLRFKYHGERGWKVPPNLRIGNTEIPLGLASVCLVLTSVAIVNLFTKSIATISGVVFTGVFYMVFAISEKVNRRKFAAAAHQMREQFQLIHRDTVQRESVGVRPGNILVAVRDYNALHHLKWILEQTDTHDQDVVVMTARLTALSAGGYDLSMEQIFSDYEQTLFTRAVSVAEKVGKHISLLVVPARDPASATVMTAQELESAAVVAGLSSRMTAAEQALFVGRAWEALAEPRRQFVLHIVRPDMTVETFTIGPHEPRTKPEDVMLIHRLWLGLTRETGLERLHHDDIITAALDRFSRHYAGAGKDEIVEELRQMRRGAQRPELPAPPELPATQPAEHQEKRKQDHREAESSG